MENLFLGIEFDVILALIFILLTYCVLKKYKVKGSMHCYAGSLEMAKEFIKLGFMIGVDGPITYSNNVKGLSFLIL